MLTARKLLLLIPPALILTGCAPPGVNFARVHCQPIQKIGSLDGVSFGADIDTYGYSGQQLVYQVVLLNNSGRPLRSIDGEYQNAAGAVSASKTLMVLQSPQSFRNTELTIPVDELEVREDDMPVSAAFTLALSDGTPIASVQRRVPLPHATLGVLHTHTPPEIPDPNSEDGEPDPADAGFEQELEEEPEQEQGAAEVPAPAPVSDESAGAPLAEEEIPASQPATRPSQPQQGPWGLSLSEAEASAIAAVFQNDAISTKKDAKNPPRSEVDGVGTRPIMAPVASDGVGGRAGDSQQTPSVAESQPAKPVERFHVVRAGETLSGIAERYFEDASLWPLIFEANRGQLESPDEVRAGIKLKIPSLSKNRGKAGGDLD